MDTETLKTAIEMFNQLGADAKDAFIWWLIVKHGATYLFGFLWTGLALIAVLMANRIIHSLLVSYRLMEAAGVYSYWNDRDAKKACEILQKYFKEGE